MMRFSTGQLAVTLRRAPELVNIVEIGTEFHTTHLSFVSFQPVHHSEITDVGCTCVLNYDLTVYHN